MQQSVVTLDVKASPPRRTHEGGFADLRSPNAGPLAKAAEDLIQRDPGRFPIR